LDYVNQDDKLSNVSVRLLDRSIQSKEQAMAEHRFREHLDKLYGAHRTAGPHVLPGFIACPAILVEQVNGNQSSIQLQVYHWAFQQALAAVRPSRLERALADNWN
jgi:hypothetical protein